MFHLQDSQLAGPLVWLVCLSSALALLTLPLALHLEPIEGARLCGLAAVTCFAVGAVVMTVPQLFPVAETYVMIMSLSFGVRMLFPLIACGLLALIVGVQQARVFAICLLIISPVLVLFETCYWTRRLSAARGHG